MTEQPQQKKLKMDDVVMDLTEEEEEEEEDKVVGNEQGVDETSSNPPLLSLQVECQGCGLTSFLCLSYSQRDFSVDYSTGIINIEYTVKPDKMKCGRCKTLFKNS